MTDQPENSQDKKLIGVLAQFDDPSSLVHACEHARDSGIKRMDAYTPFPIHGIEKAIGIPRTILPFIVLAIGISGCGIGLGLQWFTNGTENIGPWSGFKYEISGKPLFSLPANIPITFEITVLSSAFAAFLGMFALNRLPKLANPLHRVPRFVRATNDRFFLMVEAADPQFELDGLKNQFNEWGATEVEEVYEDLTDQKLPSFLKTAVVLLLLLLMVPPVLIYRASGMTVRQTRLHVVPDMDFQIKYKPQSMGPVRNDSVRDPEYFFALKRSAQWPVSGTVARGRLMTDSEYYLGIKKGSEVTSRGMPATTQLATVQQESQPQDPTGEPPAEPEPDWVTEFPPQVAVNHDTMMRGQRMYDIYCSVCHGYAGDGDGLVSQRALALAAIDSNKAAWTQAKSYYDPEVVKQPVGRLFDTITNGRATMGPYASRIEPADRWAIVLYIKALQEVRRDVPYVAPGAEEAATNQNGQGADEKSAGEDDPASGSPSSADKNGNQ